MPELIHCPTCQRELQLPEEFIGRPVKCPSCGMNFMASPSAAPTPLPRVGDVVAAAPPYGPPIYAPRPPDENQARRLVIVPAVLLLILAPLWLIADFYQIYHALTFTPEKAAETLEALPPAFRDLMRESMDRATDPDVVKASVVIYSLLAFTSLIVFLGAIQMIRLRMWPLALASGFLTIAHFDNCCCIPVNFCVGVGTVIVLFVPSVRSAFQ